MVDIANILIIQDDFKITFDGISDIADVTSRFLSYTGNTLRSRLVSIIKFLGGKRITPLVNKLLLLLQ